MSEVVKGKSFDDFGFFICEKATTNKEEKMSNVTNQNQLEQVESVEEYLQTISSTMWRDASMKKWRGGYSGVESFVLNNGMRFNPPRELRGWDLYAQLKLIGNYHYCEGYVRVGAAEQAVVPGAWLVNEKLEVVVVEDCRIRKAEEYFGVVFNREHALQWWLEEGKYCQLIRSRLLKLTPAQLQHYLVKRPAESISKYAMGLR